MNKVILIILALIAISSCVALIGNKEYQYVISFTDSQPPVTIIAFQYTETGKDYRFYDKEGNVVFKYFKKELVASILRIEKCKLPFSTIEPNSK